MVTWTFSIYKTSFPQGRLKGARDLVLDLALDLVLGLELLHSSDSQRMYFEKKTSLVLCFCLYRGTTLVVS